MWKQKEKNGSESQIFFREDRDGERVLCYAISTVGFQLQRGARPVIEGLIHLENITDVSLKKQYVQIYTRNDANNPFWWFSFKNTSVLNKWIDLFFMLKFSNEDIRNFPRLRQSLIE